MALRNEIRDFVDTFGAGSRIVEGIKAGRRAQRAQEIQQEQFDKNYGLAERRIGNQETQFEKTYGLNKQRVDLYGDQLRQKREADAAAAAEDKRRWELNLERDTTKDLESRRHTRFEEERLTRADRLASYNEAVKKWEETIKAKPGLYSELPRPDPADFGLGGAGAPRAGIPAGPESFGPRTLPGEVTSGIPAGAGTDAPAPASSAAAPSDGALSPEEPPPTEEETGEFLEPSAGAATGVVGGGGYTLEDLGITEADRREAIKGGLSHLQNYYGLNKVGISAGPDAEAGKAAFVAGKEASDPFEPEQVDYVLDDMDRANGIDPDQLSDTLKAIRRTAKSWRMFMDEGDEDNANATAANMLMQSRHASAMLAQMAAAKIKRGDVKGGIVDLKKSYEYVPNNRDVEFDVETGRYKFTDNATGKVIAEGIASPEDILGAAVGMADGSGFWREVLNSVKDEKQRELLDEPTPYEEPKAPPIELPKRAAKGMVEVNGEEFAPVEGGEEGEGGNRTPLTEAGRATIDDTIKETLSNSPIVQELLSGEPKRTARRFPGEPGAMPDQTMDWNEMQQKIGPDGMASLHELARLITEYNNVSPQRAAQLAISFADPDPSGVTHPKKRVWNFEMTEGSNERAIQLKSKEETGDTVILPTREGTAALYAASLGLNDLVTGGKTKRTKAYHEATRQRTAVDLGEKQTAREKAVGAAEDEAIRESTGSTNEGGVGELLEGIDTGLKSVTSPVGKKRGPARTVSEPTREGGVNRLKKGIPAGPEPIVEPATESEGTRAFRERMKKVRR